MTTEILNTWPNKSSFYNEGNGLSKSLSYFVLFSHDASLNTHVEYARP